MNKLPTEDLFIILSCDGKMQTQRSIKILQAISQPCLLILDKPSPQRWHGITKSVAPGAWAAAMMTLSQLTQLPERIWFIEDDVQLNQQQFKTLVEWTKNKAPKAYCIPKLMTRENHPNWSWRDMTDSPIGTFNQLCSVPKPMIKAVLAFERARFH